MFSHCWLFNTHDTSVLQYTIAYLCGGGGGGGSVGLCFGGGFFVHHFDGFVDLFFVGFDGGGGVEAEHAYKSIQSKTKG